MRSTMSFEIKVIATLMALTLLFQPVAAAAQTQDSNSGQPVNPLTGPPAYTPAGNAPAAPAPVQLPDSPGASQSLLAQPQASQPPQQNAAHEPVGTAAAEWVPASGIAASRPSGAAVAPAKQRRARSLVIKVGALLGAGAAVGTVCALSKASPSRPPGTP